MNFEILMLLRKKDIYLMRKRHERLRFLVTWRGLLFGRGELETEVEGPLAEKGRQEYKIFPLSG